MKIVFFSVFPLEYWWWLEKYYIETAKNLRNHFNDIEDITIVNLNNIFYEKFCKIISLSQIYKINPTYRYSEKEIKNNLEWIKWIKVWFNDLSNFLNKYDSIYTKNEILELIILKFIKLRKNINLIAWVHTAPVYPISNSIYSIIHNFLYWWIIYKFLAKRVDKFHVINNDNLIFLKWMFPNKIIEKIYNPFDFDNFIKKSSLYNWKYQFDRNKINILWIWRLTEQKGIKDLIFIIDNINQNINYKDKIIWNILWEWELKNEIENISKIYDNIKYFWHIENNLIPNIIENNDLFISTSKWEWFPYNILEAQAFWLPVIAYNISWCNDIIENWINWFLVNNIDDFKKKLVDFISKKVYLDKNKIKSYIISKFDNNKIYTNLYNLFK